MYEKSQAEEEAIKFCSLSSLHMSDFSLSFFYQADKILIYFPFFTPLLQPSLFGFGWKFIIFFLVKSKDKVDITVRFRLHWFKTQTTAFDIYFVKNIYKMNMFSFPKPRSIYSTVKSLSFYFFMSLATLHNSLYILFCWPAYSFLY